jgi:hypothetical protein
MSLAVIRDTVPATHRRADIRETIEQLRRENRGEERLAEALAERVEEDRRLLVDACTVLVRQALTPIETVRRRRRQDGRTSDERAQRRAVATAEVKAVAAKVKELVASTC